MTYTILGTCERSGQIGIGIATYSIAVGGLCHAMVSNRGCLTSQAFVNPELRSLGAALLANGAPASHVLDQLVAADAQAEFRQIAVIDIEGRGAAHSGNRTRSWSGHCIGPGYVALGNVLAGENVARAMEAAFLRSAAEPLSERLLRALEAGRDAGGQVGGQGHLTERSASILVHGRPAHAELDLRVDLHPDAVTELRRCYSIYKHYLPLHRLRHLDPGKAPPQEQFVAELAKQGVAAS